MHYMAFGNQSAAAAEIRTHIQLATTGLVQGSVLGVGVTQTLPLVPGRSYEIPVPVTAGQTLSMLTSSRDSYDTILVLIAPDGTPVLGAVTTNSTLQDSSGWLRRAACTESGSLCLKA
jgi:hypothetical protein